MRNSRRAIRGLVSRSLQGELQFSCQDTVIRSMLKTATIGSSKLVDIPCSSEIGMAATGLRGFASFPAHQVLGMPSLSPTMSAGNIAKWLKKEGDRVKPGDVIAEIETDKATIEWEAQEEGFVAKILVPAGTKDIKVGAQVLVLAEEEADASKFGSFTAGSDAPSSAPPTKPAPAAAAPAAPSGKSYPAHQKMGMPALSPTMSAGNIAKWLKKEGDRIKPGDVLAEVETDKATMEWESQEEGFIAKLLVPEGTKDIKLGQLVMVLVDEASDIAAFKDYTGDAEAKPAAPKPAPAAPKPAAAPSTAPAAPAAAPSAAPTRASGERVFASPWAKKLAADRGLDLAALAGVRGTGPNGRIVGADVEEFLASGGASTARAAAPGAGFAAGGLFPSFVDVPTTQIRRVIASRLVQSKQTVPHFYLSVDCRVDKLMKLREQLNASLKDSGAKLSVNDFVLKAVATAAKKYPEVNASWQDEFVRQYKAVDISVAVQTPAGLMVPIVRSACAKGLLQISEEVKVLAAKAKEGKLAPEEFTGGTFTVSNLGMFGIKQFSAIINPPQAAILAVGAARKEVVPGKSEGSFEEAQLMNLTVSCDHRVVDGALGAQFLRDLKALIEDPVKMML